MKVWREDELTDGWLSGGVEILPNLTMPLIAITAVLIVAAIAAIVRFGPRRQVVAAAPRGSSPGRDQRRPKNQEVPR